MLEVQVGGDCGLVGGEHGCDGVGGGVLHGGAGGFGEPRVRPIAVELDDVGGGGPGVRQGLPDGAAQFLGVEVGGVCAWGELRGAGVAAVLVGEVGDASGCFGAGAVAVEDEGEQAGRAALCVEGVDVAGAEGGAACGDCVLDACCVGCDGVGVALGDDGLPATGDGVGGVFDAV